MDTRTLQLAMECRLPTSGTRVVMIRNRIVPGKRRKTNRFLQAFVVIALMLCTGIAIFAQNPTGAINGTVTDPSGAIIRDAMVTATNSDTGTSRNLTTGNLGTFRFDNLQPGSYQLKVEVQGFSTQTQTLVVQVGNITTSTFSMTIGQSSEVVEVTGAASVVNTTESTISSVFNRVQVDTLPLNGRGFLSVAALDPGSAVQYVAGDSGTFPPFNAPIRVAIASPFTGEVANVQANIQVDGFRINDRFSGNASMNFSAESIQEFQLNTLTFDLSAGTSASGIVNTVTRSGTNDFHGGAFFFFRDHNMAAYPGLKRSALAPDPYFARKQIGGTLSGPIIKDKLMFFANYERTAQLGVRDIQFTDPIAYPFNHIGRAPMDNHMAGMRLDYTLSKTQNGFFRFGIDRGYQLVGGNTMESNWVANYGYNYQLAAGITSAFRPNLVNDIRFGYTYSNSGTNNMTLSECVQSSGNPGFCVGLAGPLISFSVGGLQIGTNWLSPEVRGQRVYQITDNINWTRGAHNIRFGGNWEHMYTHGNIGSYVAGTFTTFSPVQLQGLNPALYDALPPALRSVPGTKATMNDMLQLPINGMLQMGVGDMQTPPAYRNSELRSDDLVRFYIQDSWQMRRRFTVNFGLAWSMETGMPYRMLPLPKYVEPLGLNRDIIHRELNHFEPALGFAWSPGKVSKMVIRGSAALHFASQNRTLNRMGDQLMRSPAGTGAITLTSSRLINPKAGQPGQPPTLSFAAPAAFSAQDMIDYLPTARAAGLNIINRYDGKDLSITNLEVFKTSVTGGMNSIFDGNARTPYTFQVNGGFARELAKGLSLSVDYIMIRSVKFGTLDTYGLDVNRWGRFSDYTINPNTGAGNANAFRNPVLPVCTPAEADDWRSQCSTGAITLQFPGLTGRYNSLQVKVDRRMSDNLQFGLNYALTKTSAFNGFTRYDNFHDSYGITLNPKHKFSANATWGVPQYQGSNKALRGIVKGWQIGFMMQMRVGVASNVLIGSYDPVGDGINNFRLPGLDINTFGWSVDANEVRRLVAAYNAKYPAPANVALKDIPRSQRDAQGRAYPYIILPDEFSNNDSFMTHDLRLTRIFTFKEHMRLQLSIEGFNVFNIANMTGFSNTLDAYVRPSVTGGTPKLPATGLLFGQPTARVSAIFGTGGPRAFQAAARFAF
jgi:hypothetical protein